MANTKLLALTRLRYDSALYGHGHAAPISGRGLIGPRLLCVKLTISGVDFVAQGISVPISRGSPPFYDEC